MRVIVIQIIVNAFGTVFKMVQQETGGTRDEEKNRDHSDYSLVMIDQNTHKRPEETFCHSDSSEKQLALAGVKKKITQILIWK